MSDSKDQPLALEEWVGRTLTVTDSISPVQVRQMAATLNDAARMNNPSLSSLPSGWHWLYFNPMEVQSKLGEDGHPARGDFLPPVQLPRRMWAGSRLEWTRAFSVGTEVSKKSEIVKVSRKSGRSGEMVFVTVAHVYSDAEGTLLREEHDIVYRDSQSAAEKAALAEAKKAYAEGESDPETFKTKDGKTLRNVAKFQEKMKNLQADVDAHQRNIELLEKEISALN